MLLNSCAQKKEKITHKNVNKMFILTQLRKMFLAQDRFIMK